MINNENNWKLFGFDYCSLLTVDQETGKIGGTEQTAYIQVNRVSLLQPILDYAAPEWIIDSQQFCPSDVYSLGGYFSSRKFPKRLHFKHFYSNQFHNSNRFSQVFWSTVSIQLTKNLLNCSEPVWKRTKHLQWI